MSTLKTINGSEQFSDSNNAQSALINFYCAFNNRDMKKMQCNWLQTHHASMSNPLGNVKRGWAEIEKVYQKIFNGPAQVFVEFYDFTVHETDNMFLAVGRERGQLRTNNFEIQLHIRTTRIYQKINNQWKHIHHHGSIDNAVRLSRYQNAILNSSNSGEL